MVYVVGFLLFAIAAWFVAYPIFRPPTLNDKGADGQREFNPDRSGMNLMMQELELDRALGNISEEDYRAVNETYQTGIDPSGEEGDRIGG